MLSRSLWDIAVLQAELSNKQKAQTSGTGSRKGTGSRTYWLCQELRRGKALEKSKKKEMLLMMVNN